MTQEIFTRNSNVWEPRTFDERNNSVRVTAVTENPVRVWDWKRDKIIDEILLVGGMILPPNGRVPLLDSHQRLSVSNVLGSATNFKQVGRTLECEVYFSGTDVGREAAQKVKEGHLTDFSVGYSPIESFWIAEGEEKTINGCQYKGPVKVTSAWDLRELSVTPAGADPDAKARAMAMKSIVETPAYPSAPEVKPAPEPARAETPSPPPAPDKSAPIQQSFAAPAETPQPPKESQPALTQEPMVEANEKHSIPIPELIQKPGKKGMDIVDIVFLVFIVYMIFALLTGGIF